MMRRLPMLVLLSLPAAVASAQEPAAAEDAPAAGEAAERDRKEPKAERASVFERVREKLGARGLDDSEIELIITAANAVKSAADRRPSEIDPAVLGMLDGEQLSRVLVAQEAARKARYERNSEPPAVAIVVPVASFLFVVGLVWVVLHLRNRGLIERQQTLRLMVEQGREIPPGLVAQEEKKQGSDRRRGVILLSTSLGVGAFLWVVDPTGQAWSLGLVPFMLGLGYMVAHRLEEGTRDLP